MGTPMSLDDIKKYCSRVSLTIQRIDERVVVAINHKTGMQQIFTRLQAETPLSKKDLPVVNKMEVQTPRVEAVPLSETEKRERALDNMAALKTKEKQETIGALIDIEIPEVIESDGIVAEANSFAAEPVTKSLPSESIEEKLQPAKTTAKTTVKKTTTKPKTGQKTTATRKGGKK